MSENELGVSELRDRANEHDLVLGSDRRRHGRGSLPKDVVEFRGESVHLGEDGSTLSVVDGELRSESVGLSKTFDFERTATKANLVDDVGGDGSRSGRVGVGRGSVGGGSGGGGGRDVLEDDGGEGRDGVESRSRLLEVDQGSHPESRVESILGEIEVPIGREEFRSESSGERGCFRHPEVAVEHRRVADGPVADARTPPETMLGHLLLVSLNS